MWIILITYLVAFLAFSIKFEKHLNLMHEHANRAAIWGWGDEEREQSIGELGKLPLSNLFQALLMLFFPVIFTLELVKVLIVFWSRK